MSLFPCQPLIYVSISLHSHFLPHPSSMLYSIHLLLPQLYIFFSLNFLPQVNFVPRGTPFFHCEIKFLILRPWNLNDPSFLYIIPHFHPFFPFHTSSLSTKQLCKRLFKYVGWMLDHAFS